MTNDISKTTIRFEMKSQFSWHRQPFLSGECIKNITIFVSVDVDVNYWYVIQILSFFLIQKYLKLKNDYKSLLGRTSAEEFFIAKLKLAVSESLIEYSS